MQKIISLFQRNYDGDRLVRDEVVPGAEWVTEGEGTATRKWNGTCCKVENRVLFKRYDAKHGKTPPPDFIPAQDPDPVTGHWPGWVPVGNGPNDRWFLEAITKTTNIGTPMVVPPPDGTYELVGPKVNGNPEGVNEHALIPHGNVRYLDAPRDFDGLHKFLAMHDIEGLVWHHPDGRMVKIKARDFGIRR
jgi:hypothetical protein